MAIVGTFKKQPVEVLDYDIDFAGFLAGSDTLQSVATTVSPVGGLVVDSATVIGERVKVWLSGGVDGTSYKITVTVTTADGRVKQDEFKIRVKDN